MSSDAKNLTLADYRDLLEKSGLLKAKIIESQWKQFHNDPRERSAERFGQFLIQSDQITEWHH
ncbi:MAG: hypothetical protein N2C14_06060, partial [Planctomycetales bacterium]